MGLFGPKLPMSLYDLLARQMRSIETARFRDDISADAFERMHMEILKRIDMVLAQDEQSELEARE